MEMVKKLSAATTTAVLTLLAAAPVALAAGEGEAGGGEGANWSALAAGICISVAALGGALGQGRAASAALEGIARNPGASGRIFVPMLLGLAFIESLVIYALIIAFRLS